MENLTTSDTKKVIGALLVGTAIGAALGILFAPEKGTRTRQKISDTGEDLAEMLKDKFNAFLEGVKDQYESIKGKATEFAESDGKATSVKSK